MSEGHSEYSHEEHLRRLSDPGALTDVGCVVDVANKTFEEVLGLNDKGKDVWNTVTIPNACEAYRGCEPTKLAKKLLEIIDKAGSKVGEEATTEYLRTAISQDEIEFSRIDKEEDSKKLVSDIEEYIKEYASCFGDRYKGVVALVIWGSYARFQQRLDSDIDATPISIGDPEGFMHGDQWVSPQNFEAFMSTKLGESRKRFINTESGDRATLSDEHSIREMIYLETPEFLVASPFPGVKKRVQMLLEDQIKNVQTE